MDGLETNNDFDIVRELPAVTEGDDALPGNDDFDIVRELPAVTEGDDALPGKMTLTSSQGHSPAVAQKEMMLYQVR